MSKIEKIVLPFLIGHLSMVVRSVKIFPDKVEIKTSLILLIRSSSYLALDQPLEC